MRQSEDFTLTEDHLKLLRAMFLTWDACEAGAPAVDPKRPYGNSYVPADIRRILGWHQPSADDEGDRKKSDEAAYVIHRETRHALQIVLSHGTIIGRYRLTNKYDYSSWTKVDSDVNHHEAPHYSSWTKVDSDANHHEAPHDLQRLRAMESRLLEWASQLEATRDMPGDVGKFIAAELRNRMAGTTHEVPPTRRLQRLEPAQRARLDTIAQTRDLPRIDPGGIGALRRALCTLDDGGLIEPGDRADLQHWLDAAMLYGPGAAGDSRDDDALRAMLRILDARGLGCGLHPSGCPG